MTRRSVLVVGNPNTGKSTLFNALTGGQAKVGNFAGTTVVKSVGELTLPRAGRVSLVDVPGTYSLAASRPDERVAIDAILGLGPDRGQGPDAMVVVVDGARLMRSLYLVLQLLELGVPMLVCVNLMDEAQAAGLQPDLSALAKALGVPVVGTVARRGEGIDALRGALDEVLAEGGAPQPVHAWSTRLQQLTDQVVADLPSALRHVGDESVPERARAVARWLLLSADEHGRVPGLAEPLAAVRRVRGEAALEDRDLQAELVATRYAWIDAREGVFLGRSVVTEPDWTERIDRVALHPWLGSLLFVAVTALGFTALFSWADPMIEAIEWVMKGFGDGVGAGFDALIAATGATAWAEVLRDLVVEGIIGGVGAVIVFLPQIALLFLFLAILEDCGYLARAAHLADRVLRAAGLPGQAFVPLLSGYACAVPAILATRTMPRFRDRLLTMLVLPLTSCSARLPVYTLLIAALFPATLWGPIPLRPVALAGMYLFSTLVALGAAVLLGTLVFPAGADAALIELPPYRVPSPRLIARQVWHRCTDFLREAGGIILVATILLWGLLSFPRVEPEDVLEPEVVATAQAEGVDLEALAAPLAMEQSYGGRLGKAIEPVLKPLGYDWKIGIGLVGAFAAREVFVSTMGVVYGIGDDVDEENPALRDKIRRDRRPDGSLTYTPLVGASIMVFFALSLQCLSTIAVLRKESGSWGWPIAAFVWTGGLAWAAAFVVYQTGRWFGLS